jgi:hypothetical protein
MAHAGLGGTVRSDDGLGATVVLGTRPRTRPDGPTDPRR